MNLGIFIFMIGQKKLIKENNRKQIGRFEHQRVQISDFVTVSIR